MAFNSIFIFCLLTKHCLSYWGQECLPILISPGEMQKLIWSCLKCRTETCCFCLPPSQKSGQNLPLSVLILFHSRLNFHMTLWLQRLALPIRDIFHRQVKCQAGIIRDRKSHSCFCMFCCPEKSNSLSKRILFLPKHSTSPTFWRNLGILDYTARQLKVPSFLPSYLFLLLPHTHCGVQIFGNAI